MDNKPSYMDIDESSNVIVINGHEIAYQSSRSLVIDSGAISMAWMNVTPANVRVIVHADKMVIDDLNGKDRRLYLKFVSEVEASSAAAYFAKHGFAVESHL